jgi:hypothetical protein
MFRIVAAIVLVAVLAVGGGIIATTAYQAGLSTAVTAAAADGATTVAPVVVPAYGWGWGWGGPGFGFFGFLFFLFFLFIVIGLIRAVVFGGRGRRGWGPGWDGQGGPGDHRGHGWSRAHDTFEAWHREAHQDPTTPRPSTSQPPAPPAPSA